MNKAALKSKYPTKYQSYLIDRFADEIPDDETNNADYHIKNQFLFILGAPEDYGIEEEMMEFIRNKMNVTIQELEKRFGELIPDGTPPVRYADIE